MLAKLTNESKDSLFLELTDDTNVGTIGGYCEEGFPIYYANDRIANMLGYEDVEDFIEGIGGLVSNTIHPEDMDRVVKELNNGNFYEGMTYKVTYRMPKKDGSWIWTVDRGKVIKTEDSRLAILSVCNDMTDFIDHHAQLEHQNMISKSTLENMPGGYHQCAAEEGFPFLYISDRFLELFGWTREEIQTEFDNKFINMLHPEDRLVTNNYVNRIEQEANTNKISDEIYRMRGKKGYIWVSDATTLVKIKDKSFYHGTLTDITGFIEERQEKEKQLSLALAAAEQSSHAKTTFLNNMSHDIRTPMNAIIGFTALAQTHIDNTKEVEDYLAKINTSSNHLLSLINDILDMSRIESGSVKLEEKNVHLPDLLHDLRTMILPQVNAKNQNLYIDTQDVHTEDVVTDKLRLNQVLLNIVGNAVKFTPVGGDIIIRLEEKPCKRKDYVTYEFSIKDNGIGMSKEFQKHIFETFAREYTSTVSGIQGTGLGMAITKNIVEMMGGEIQVESREGKGSTFIVTLDMRRSDKVHRSKPIFMSELREVLSQPVGEELTEAEKSEKKHYDYRGKKVLLVEDNELNREIALAILEETGMKLDCAEDGIEAVNIINESPSDTYDLILMDIQMPRMDGYTATREIRTLRDNKKANIPIVAMTANAFEEDKKKAIETGMNDHIAKPINIDVIAETLDRIFGTDNKTSRE